MFQRKWPEEKIPIDMEPLPGFNLRAQVVGHQGSYVKHIQQETRCRVQIKGRGSGFTDVSTGQEAEEPMVLHVAYELSRFDSLVALLTESCSGPDANDVKRAKELCEDLLGNVRQQYQRHKENPPQRAYGGGGGYGQQRSSYESGYGAGYGSSNSGGTDRGY